MNNERYRPRPIHTRIIHANTGVIHHSIYTHKRQYLRWVIYIIPVHMETLHNYNEQSCIGTRVFYKIGSKMPLNGPISI